MMTEVMSQQTTTPPVTGGPREPGWELVKLPAPSHPRPKPIAENARVLAHYSIADRYRFLSLHAPGVAATALPGQFVMITLARSGESAPALPRPMAIYRRDPQQGTIEILYGVVGDGTRRLSTFATGENLLIVGPLGRPFEITDDSSVLLIGRGIGTCSLTTVAQDAQVRGIRTVAVTSGRSRSALIGADFYRVMGAERVYEVCDDDATSTPESLYSRLSTDLDANPPGLILTCGSDRLTRMCEGLSARWDSPVQVSVEAHMACGIGYCHGCASGARSEGEESPLICTDGPVFGWRREANATS